MESRNKWAIGIGVTVVILLVLAVVLYFVLRPKDSTATTSYTTPNSSVTLTSTTSSPTSTSSVTSTPPPTTLLLTLAPSAPDPVPIPSRGQPPGGYGRSRTTKGYGTSRYGSYPDGQQPVYPGSDTGRYCCDDCVGKGQQNGNGITGGYPNCEANGRLPVMDSGRMRCCADAALCLSVRKLYSDSQGKCDRYLSNY